MNEIGKAFWGTPSSELPQQLDTTPQGLTGEDAQKRLSEFGLNLLKPKKRSGALTLLLAQFKSPVTLLLLFAAGLSLFLHDPADALIILTIVFASSLLGLWQERRVAKAAVKLLDVVQTNEIQELAH